MTTLLQIAAGVVIGIALYLSARNLVAWPALHLGLPGWIAILVALPVLFWILVGVHEGGHLVAGRLARFTPCLFIVGPLKLERTDRGWRAGINRVFPLAGGLVAATPDGNTRLRQRMIGLTAGGPLASLVFGGAILTALVPLATSHPVLSGAAATGCILLVLLGCGSLALGLLALIPGQGHGFSSDGARILRFVRPGPGVDAEVALLGLVGASMSGQRPRQWDEALVESSLALQPDSPLGAGAQLMAHVHALDRGEVARARQHLQIALSQVSALPAMSRPSLLLQAAAFAALYDHDIVRARRYLNEAGEGALVSPHSRPMAEGAILLREGHQSRAAEALARAASELGRALDRGGAVMAADQIDRMRSLLDTSAADRHASRPEE